MRPKGYMYMYIVHIYISGRDRSHGDFDAQLVLAHGEALRREPRERVVASGAAARDVHAVDEVPAVSPQVPAQMWHRVGPVPAQMWAG